MAWKEYPYVAQFTHHGASDYIYRPLINVSVSGKERTRTIKGLIDSGTEITMMDAQIADLLGIKREGSERGIASSLGADKEGFLNKVNIQIEGFNETMTFTVLFIEDLGSNFDILLGQQDFFRRFSVTFEKSKNIFKLALASTLTPDGHQ